MFADELHDAGVGFIHSDPRTRQPVFLQHGRKNGAHESVN